LAAGGTLGILIPPSIPLILYGVIANQSILQLFMAGIGPGLFLAVAFTLVGVMLSRFSATYQPIPKATWSERGRATLLAMPTILLAVAIIGSIYTGIATPTESAGLGAVLALVLVLGMRRLDWEGLKLAVTTSMRTTVMVLLIVAGAKLFAFAITLYMIPQQISLLLSQNFTSAGLFILAVGIVLLLMGFVLETLSMLLIMVPVLLGAVLHMHIDPIWFGIFFVVLIELGLITPPVGMNLYVIQSVANARLSEVVRGAVPFAIVMILTAVLMWFWQDLVLWLPRNL
jgi:tripartite ATP-independent transporter DctM subunit